jgi:hypothetical protein
MAQYLANLVDQPLRSAPEPEMAGSSEAAPTCGTALKGVTPVLSCTPCMQSFEPGTARCGTVNPMSVPRTLFAYYGMHHRRD